MMMEIYNAVEKILLKLKFSEKLKSKFFLDDLENRIECQLQKVNERDRKNISQSYLSLRSKMKMFGNEF